MMLEIDCSYSMHILAGNHLLLNIMLQNILNSYVIISC